MPYAPDPYESAAKSLADRDLGLAPKVVRYSSLKRRRVEWVWPLRLPVGKLVILDGDPDVGKSTLSLDMAARLTTATPLPDGYVPPAPTNVLFLRAEDGAADTVLPRLLAAGGDPSRFMELEGLPEVNEAGQLSYRPPELPTDLLGLAQVIEEEEIGLVLIDPLVAFLADWINANRDQQIRRALAPLALVAERTGATILAIRHLNKTTSAPTLYRGGGSIGILAAARLVLVAGHDPDNKGRRLLGVLKSNLAPKAETLAYRIVPHDLYDVGQVAWEGSSPRSANDILLLASVDEDERSAVDEAVIFLFALLDEGPIPAKDALAQARQLGISERALDKAKRSAGVIIERQAGKGRSAPWLWRLPDPERLFEDDGRYGEAPDVEDGPG